MNKTAEITFQALLLLSWDESARDIGAFEQDHVHQVNVVPAAHSDRYLLAHINDKRTAELADTYKDSHPGMTTLGYPLSVRRPQLVGLLTENIVYKRVPEGVLDELKKLNPKDERGCRKRRHHQFLTDDIGNPHLEKHVASAITLMKISSSYKGFKKHLDKALPVPKSQLQLPFGDDDEEENGEAAN
jgi:P63C domain